MNRILIRSMLLLAALAVVPACGVPRGDDGVVSSEIFVQNLGMRLAGGSGTTGKGGNGGFFIVSSNTGGDILMKSSASIDSRVVATVQAPDLGANPKTISASTALSGAANVVGSTILGDDGINPATGLWVKSGATLTLTPNLDTNLSPGTFEEVSLSFPPSGLSGGAVYIQGTLVVGPKDGTTAPADLTLTAAQFVIEVSGTIDTSSADSIAVADDGGAVTLVSTFTVLNDGILRTFGGKGTSGGRGGAVTLSTDRTQIHHQGTINTSGGFGTAGTGGDAGSVTFRSDLTPALSHGGTFNPGLIVSRGGDGTTGGGAGGAVNVEDAGVGAVASSGDIDASGGSATVGGSGGFGGDLSFKAGNGSIRVTGRLSTRGGRGAGAGGNGNHGGVLTASSVDGGNGLLLPIQGGIAFGADLDASGGNGEIGGDAGGVFVLGNVAGTNVTPGVDLVVVAGYRSIDSLGGAGATGGDGGDFLAVNGIGKDSVGNSFMGGVRNEIPINSIGGRGTTANGGNGGPIDLMTDPATGSVPDYERSLVNSAALKSQGGDGAVDGGSAKRILMLEHYRVTNSGALTVLGGKGGTGDGGSTLMINLVSDGPVMNTGAIVCNGGDTTGGIGGLAAVVGVRIFGGTVSSVGITANGGRSVTGPGGDGGAAIALVSNEAPSVIHGTLSVKGGLGTAPGANGTIEVDGLLLGIPSGSITY